MTSLARRIFSEWLGTTFLLSAVVGSGIMAQKLAGGNVALALLCNTIPTGAILTVLILIFGPGLWRTLQPGRQSRVLDPARAASGNSSCLHGCSNYRGSRRSMGRPPDV